MQQHEASFSSSSALVGRDKLRHYIRTVTPPGTQDMTSPVLWPTSAPAAAIPNDVPLFVGDFRHQRQQQQQQSVSSSSADNDSTSLFAPQFDFDADNWRLLQELLELEREIIRNYTQRGDEDASDPLTRPAVRAAVVVVFVAVIAVGVAANSVVLCVVIASRRLKTVTNVFIGNLAVSDLWLCILSLPVQLHYQMTEKWIFGPALCRIVFPAFAVPLYSSILSILWIAVDRYRLIVCPLRRRWSTRAALGMIAAGVLVSVIIAIPVSLVRHSIIGHSIYSSIEYIARMIVYRRCRYSTRLLSKSPTV